MKKLVILFLVAVLSFFFINMKASVTTKQDNYPIKKEVVVKSAVHAAITVVNTKVLHVSKYTISYKVIYPKNDNPKDSYLNYKSCLYKDMITSVNIIVNNSCDATIILKTIGLVEVVDNNTDCLQGYISPQQISDA